MLNKIFYNLHFASKDDIVLSRAVFMYFVVIAANSSIKTAFNLEGTSNGSLLTTISFLILLFFLIKGILVVFRRNVRLLVSSYAIFAAIFFVSISINIISNNPIDLILSYNLVQNFGLWIPIGCCACTINNKEVLYKVGLNYSFLISAFLFLTFYVNNGTLNEGGADKYDMSFGFSMMLPLIFHFNEFFRHKKLIFLLFALVELFALVLYGNRGALLSVAFFIIAYGWLSIKNVKIRILVVLLLTLFGSIIFLYINEILIDLAVTITSQGFEHSRTLQMFIAGDMDDSGRNLLRSISYKMIIEKPFLGWGFGGEYYEIARQYAHVSMSHVSEAYNSHNGLIQNFVNFGLFGGLISSCLVLKPYFTLSKIKDNYLFELLLIFGALNIPRMISATGFFVYPDAAVFIYLYYYKTPKQYASNNILPFLKRA